MEKEFNRAMAKELANRIQEVLFKFVGDDGYAVSVSGATFTSDKLKLNVEVRMKGSDGSIVFSENTHAIADAAAHKVGVKYEGHILGSSWMVDGKLYNVIGYSSRRHAYPLSLKREDGSAVRASMGYLMRGTQVTKPTLEDFTKWFTMDPESDAILESDAEICDRVQSYLESNYPIEDGDKFFNLVDKFNELGIAKKWAKRAYELLFEEAPATMKYAYLGMKVIYAELTRVSKPKNARKSGKTKSSAK